ncbi:hypothetical protein IF1G_05038 [Cordyceps javanica]|uniref:Uncharacterized protein n=1 Tax=Cordyceps javanica TaxID=43265 RepID=A0A545V422_9HYPO|nr:hypothetical protein IF1G_05038 [Cordyceps javanica]TQW07744.1 hypothetical protein IF2G_04905 [Cordyceps javanica]
MLRVVGPCWPFDYLLSLLTRPLWSKSGHPSLATHGCTVSILVDLWVIPYAHPPQRTEYIFRLPSAHTARDAIMAWSRRHCKAAMLTACRRRSHPVAADLGPHSGASMHNLSQGKPTNQPTTDTLILTTVQRIPQHLRACAGPTWVAAVRVKQLLLVSHLKKGGREADMPSWPWLWPWPWASAIRRGSFLLRRAMAKTDWSTTQIDVLRME